MESPLPKEIGPIRSHWNALCALDVGNVWSASDVKSSLSKAGTKRCGGNAGHCSPQGCHMWSQSSVTLDSTSQDWAQQAKAGRCSL
jgi:hypothetical protein